MIRVKSDRRLITLFLRLKRLIGGKVSLSFIRALVSVFDQLRSIQKQSGNKGLVLYLKAVTVCIQQACSGHRLQDLSPLKARISRTKGSKLPRIIPAVHRRIIANKFPGYLLLIKFYLTLFYLYRVISFTPSEKLSTITAIGKDFNLEWYAGFMPLFIKRFFGYYREKYWRWLFKYRSTFSILKSSPSANSQTWSTHPISLIKACWALKNDATIYSAFCSVGGMLNPDLLGFVKAIRGKLSLVPLGKLGFKEEAAGKLRVFAMVDALTQWMLYPLHKFIFTVLRRIPMDGTHNQLKPLKRLLRLGCERLYSLDLSAATDRLPVILQAKLLDILFSSHLGFGGYWKTLLVGRAYTYVLPFSKSKGAIKYAVGQPMGALSSWAMLALTHHFIVQVAAWSIGYPKTRLFTRYALLGDDIVIGERDVANKYLKILADLGVECGIAKSIISPSGSGVEFAKRTFIDNVDVSPISLKELSVALSDLSAWAAFVAKYPMTLSEQGRFLGYGYKVVTNETGFRHMNHAFRALFLSQIPRVSITSQFLTLDRKFPVDLEPILDEFKNTVLVPLRDQMLREFWLCVLLPMQNEYRQLWFKGGRTMNFWALVQDGLYSSEISNIVKMMREVDETQMLAILQSQYAHLCTTIGNSEHLKPLWADLLELDKSIRPPLTETVAFYDLALAKIVKSERPKIIKDLGKTLFLLSDLSSIKNMDEALALYIKLLKEKATPNISALLVDEEVAREQEGRLPFQNRLFRSWSRLANRLAKLSKPADT